jgi:hypothetical protein
MRSRNSGFKCRPLIPAEAGKLGPCLNPGPKKPAASRSPAVSNSTGGEPPRQVLVEERFELLCERFVDAFLADPRRPRSSVSKDADTCGVSAGDAGHDAEALKAEPPGRRWGIGVLVPLSAALLGAVVGAGGGVFVADRQMAESRREVARQISADRAGRLSDVRADTYGQFVSAVDRHLETIGEPSETSIRNADENISAALRLVQLRGSAVAFAEAGAIVARARALTNGAITAIQRGRRTPVRERPFFAQQQALNRFVHDLQPELRK